MNGLNMAKLLEQDRVKDIRTLWSEEELAAIHEHKVPPSYVRLGVLTKEAYEEALKVEKDPSHGRSLTPETPPEAPQSPESDEKEEKVSEVIDPVREVCDAHLDGCPAGSHQPSELDSFTDDQLKEIGKELKIRGAHLMKRDTLIERIKSAPLSPPAEEGK